jgi:serine/threonine-protein kinase
VVQGTPGKRRGITFQLGKAQLELVPITMTSANPWGFAAPAFDVIAHAGVILRIPKDRHEFEGRSHSLWYCDAFETGRYEWTELAFMASPLVRGTTPMRPFMADPGPEAAKGLWTGMAEFQLAWPIEPIDPDSFIDRWSSWLADASQGRFSAPRSMPERPTPRNWRQK